MSNSETAFPIDRVNGKAASLAERLKVELSGNQLAVGDRFYTIKESASRYRVSLSTARKAMASLADEGYIKSQQGSGHFVSRKPEASSLSPATTESPRNIQRRSGAWLLLVIGSQKRNPDTLLESYLSGLQLESKRAGYRVEVVRNDRATLLERTADSGVKGLVAYHLDEPLAVNLDTLPVASFGYFRVCDHQASVYADIQEGMYTAFRRLFGLGHSNALMLVADKPHFDSHGGEEFISGMRRAFSDFTMAWDSSFVRCVSPEELEPDADLLRRLIGEGVSAVVCPEWPTPLPVYRQAHQSGLVIGRDFSVIAHGSHSTVDLLQPSITRIAWKSTDYAASAVKAIQAASASPRADVSKVFRVPIYLHAGHSVASMLE